MTELAAMNLSQPLTIGSEAIEFGDISWACWPTYRRQSLAMGGDHMASFSFSADDSILEHWLDNYLAAHFVESYAGVTTFVGLIWSMRLNYHGVMITRTLDKMYNHIRVRYQTSSSSAKTVTSTASDSASIARYGTRQLLEELTDVYVSATTAGYYRDNLLTNFALPRARQQETRLYGERQYGVLQVEVRGYIHTLNNILQNSVSTSLLDADDEIIAILSAAEFVTQGNIEANSAQVAAEADYQPGWERIKKIVELGSNGGSKWLAGCYQGYALDYYEADASTIAYEQEMRTQRRLTFAPDEGVHIPAPLVQPGGVVFTRDIMGGRPVESTLLDDPRAMFVDMVEYSKDGAVLKGAPDDDTQKSVALALALRRTGVASTAY